MGRGIEWVDVRVGVVGGERVVEERGGSGGGDDENVREGTSHYHVLVGSSK